jgi:hypothetical protein
LLFKARVFDNFKKLRKILFIENFKMFNGDFGSYKMLFKRLLNIALLFGPMKISPKGTYMEA